MQFDLISIPSPKRNSTSKEHCNLNSDSNVIRRCSAKCTVSECVLSTDTVMTSYKYIEQGIPQCLLFIQLC